jgi:hypothetical protein
MGEHVKKEPTKARKPGKTRKPADKFVTRKIPSSSCPNCGATLDAASGKNRGGHAPAPNDFTVCVQCAQPAAFDENLRLRKLTAVEELGAQENPELQQAIRLLKRLQRDFLPDGTPRPRPPTPPPSLGTVAEVMWVETGEGRGLCVKASDPGNLGVATIVLCQAISKCMEFDQDTRDAAIAFAEKLIGGKKLPVRPFDIYRGQKDSA